MVAIGIVMNNDKPTHYTVTDRTTGKVYERKTRKSARLKADRLDNAYGAYIATVKPVYVEG